MENVKQVLVDQARIELLDWILSDSFEEKVLSDE